MAQQITESDVTDAGQSRGALAEPVLGLDTSSLDAFDRTARDAGFHEALERVWEPGTVLPEHSHPFDAYAVLMRGSMWLTCNGETRYIGPGGTFFVPKGTLHAERYGEAGATYWVARA